MNNDFHPQWSQTQETDPTSAENYILDFSRPEPRWFSDVSEVVLKLILVFLPVPLLIFSKPEEINEKRYKLVAGIFIFLIIAAYGGLSAYSYIQGLGLREIAENAVFAFASIFVTFLTYWLTRSPNAASQ